MPVPKVLNPLPSTVTIQASTFTSSLVSMVSGNIWNFLSYYPSAGDLNNDGYPELVYTGWHYAYQGMSATSTPPTSPIWMFSTNNTTTTRIDPTTIIGTNVTYGTTEPRIFDLNRDGKNDFFYLAHNESPVVGRPSEVFLQTTSGNFIASTLAGPGIASHNSNIGDFNRDGYPDIIASTYAVNSGYFSTSYGATSENYNEPLVLYLNNGDGSFVPYAFIKDRPFANSGQFYFKSGSASAMGDLDGDGNTEVVFVDAPMLQSDGTWTVGRTWLASNIVLHADHTAFVTINQLPLPYYDRDNTWAGYTTQFDDLSHQTKVDIFDFDNDGRGDIVISTYIAGDKGGTTGVFQMLRNLGGLRFEDVTDSTLHNFTMFAGGAGHNTEFIDINGDGFLDIVSPEGAGFEGWTENNVWGTLNSSWANRVLINAGNGKFVQTMLDSFHELTLTQSQLVNNGIKLQSSDHPVIPYMLPDGRFGFIANQVGTVSGEQTQTYFFDYRTTTALSTGPGGSNAALQGAPGFSEYYYLTQYPEVAAAVSAGTFSSGLDHYLRVGKAAGNSAFASNVWVHGSEKSDLIQLREGSERAYGYAGDDQIIGGAGNDTIDGGGGNDQIDGGADIDTTIYSGKLINYTFAKLTNAAGIEYAIQDKTGRDGTDTLKNVEILRFADRSINLTIQSQSKDLAASDISQLCELYVAFFNRVPDADGLLYWINQQKSGKTLDQIADALYGAGILFSQLTGFSASMSNADFINVLYRNVLGRKDGADQEGLSYWENKLIKGEASRSSIVSTILHSAHTFKGDSNFGYVADLLDNKVAVARKVAIDWGINFNTSEESISNGIAIAAAVTPTNTENALSLVGIDLHFVGF